MGDNNKDKKKNKNKIVYTCKIMKDISNKPKKEDMDTEKLVSDLLLDPKFIAQFNSNNEEDNKLLNFNTMKKTTPKVRSLSNPYNTNAKTNTNTKPHNKTTFNTPNKRSTTTPPHKSPQTVPKLTSNKKPYINFQLTSQNYFELKPNIPFSNTELNQFLRKHHGKYHQRSNTWSFNIFNYNTIHDFIAISPLCKEYSVVFLPQLTLNYITEPDTPKVIQYAANKGSQAITIDYSNDKAKTLSLSNLPIDLLSMLYPFQKEGIKYGISKHCRFLLADEMGIGKTIQAIGLSLLYKEDWPVLVICPAPLTFIWRDELTKWAKTVSYQILQSSKDTFCKGGEYYIVSYELIPRLAEKITAMHFKFIIADEGHYLRNMSSVRFKTLIPYMAQAKRLIAITGTPIFHHPVDIFPLLKALRPDVFKSHQQFIERYTYKNYHKNHLEYNSGNGNGSGNEAIANQKEFTFIMNKVMIRRLKEEVLMDLPPKHRQRIEIAPAKEHLSQIRILMKKIVNHSEFDFKLLNAFNDNEDISEYSQQDQHKNKEEKSKSIGNKDIPSSSLLCFHKAYSLTGLAKLNGIKDYIGCLIESKCPFIIYAHHIQVIDELESYIKSSHVKYLRLDGYVPINQREERIKAYQNDSTCLIALLSFTAFSLGINLSKASTVVFAELHFSFALMMQAEDRVHRMGQKMSVNVHYLYARETIDDLLMTQIRDDYFLMGEVIKNSKMAIVMTNGNGKGNSKGITNMKSSKQLNSTTQAKSNMEMEDFFTPITKVNPKMMNIHSKSETIVKKLDFTETNNEEEEEKYEKASPIK